MALFDLVNFNGEVFDAVLRETPNLRMNELLHCGAIVEQSKYASMLPDQKGGNFITTLIKARLSGKGVNYDGKTDITADERGNYAMGRIVVGRAQAWVEKDFTSDISGDDYSAAAGEVAEFWDDVDQDTLLSTLKGVFSMSTGEGKNFVAKHTYDISANEDGTFGATTLNTGMQVALGDKKANFALTVMHSHIATGLENLNLLEYMKYTDSNGIERNLPLATLNGRIVLVDDTMPTRQVDAVYTKTTDQTVQAGKTYYEQSTKEYKPVGSPSDNPATTGYYEKTADAYTEYTTYVLGNGAIEYTNCGVKVSSEMNRNPAKNGGETTLYTRQRKVFCPYGISWKTPTIVSPTAAQLEDGSNWEIAQNNESGSAKYYPIKAINIMRIITRG
uniref:phage coat protein n=1 Tax=Agathobacter sp. TaxID=2021311 RepID=UPI004027CAA7